MNNFKIWNVNSYIYILYLIFSLLPLQINAANTEYLELNEIVGQSVNLKTFWIGREKVSNSLHILVLAGHADSQGLAGSGTAGEAVDIKGANPMDKKLSDELFWNLKVRDEVVRLGKEMGLMISSYDPLTRNIYDGNNPKTNWSIGANHVREGGYAFEIHFDSYGEHGFGSGLIPAFSTDLNTVDESLARTFGRYPLFFRGGLGAPRRGIRLLEIGKLEGDLEKNLRDPSLSQKTINKIAKIIVDSLLEGIN